MDERLSLKAVDEYSDDFASKVSTAFFSNKDKISGPEILKLCKVHQVNLFVIRELLRAWHHEGQKLRSPYFDYSAPEVKKELEKFQNLLSNHILISRENFQPLLKKAVSQTLYLLVDPYDFYSDTLDKQVKTADLKADIRYLRINRAPLEKLVQRLEQKGLDTITGKEAFAMLDQVLEEVNFTPEDIEPHAKLFSETVVLNIEKLYEVKAAEPEKKPLPEKKSEPEKKPEPEKKAEPIQVRAEMPKASPIKQEQLPLIPKPEPPAPKKQEVPVVNITTKKEVKGSLADNFQKISSIKDSLTINQKFMFTKMLFKGDFEIFSEAIEKLDRLDNLSQAMKYFDENYPEWDKESEEYEEFIELVQKRFA